MNISRTIALTALSLVAGAACSSTPTLSSGVDGNKNLSEISTDEKKSLCEALTKTGLDFQESAKEGLCKFGGALAAAFAGGEAACDAAVKMCTEAPATVSQTAADCEGSVDLSGCNATVEELETCYNETLGILADFYDELGGQSCGELLSSSGSGPTGTPPAEPEACKTLKSKCPNAPLPGSTSTSTST